MNQRRPSVTNADMFTVIGGYLYLDDILAARLVCTQWHDWFKIPPLELKIDGGVVTASRRNYYATWDGQQIQAGDHSSTYGETYAATDRLPRWKTGTHSAMIDVQKLDLLRVLLKYLASTFIRCQYTAWINTAVILKAR